jgi:hypothetical protein
MSEFETGEAGPADEPNAPRRYKRRKPFTYEVEVVRVGGEQGRHLAQVQATAIGEVLEWLAANRPPPAT